VAKYEIHPLGLMMGQGIDRELLDSRLKGFLCKRDTQLERFIHEQAVIYEQRGFGRTYLVFDPSVGADNSIPSLAAFFTLAITATDYSGISKSKREKVLGSKPGRDTFEAFGGILIGQLARDDRYDASFINGSELLIECEKYIARGRQHLGGRIVYLDCRGPLVETYRQSNYKLLVNEPNDDGYFKMYKVLPDEYV
jgi:hypothetical protein